MGSHTENTTVAFISENLHKTKQRKCKSSSRPSRARPSPLRWSPQTPSRMSRPRSRTRRASPGPAEVDLRWQAAGGRKDPFRLQHPEGVNSPSCAPSQGRKLSCGSKSVNQSDCISAVFTLINSKFTKLEINV